MASHTDPSRAPLLRRSALSLAVMLLVVALLLFLPAGIAWRRGWLFLAAFAVLAITSSAYLWRVNPDIFVARSKVHQGTRSWDKVLLVPVLAAFFAIFLIAGLDARLRWSAAPGWLVIAGYVLFVAGFVLSTWVYAVNRFAEPSVRIQSDRGQRVVQTGPYAFVRHPLYLFSLPLAAGMALAPGSYWALLPVAVGVIVILVRTALEDRMLRNELEGYNDYAARVRYRLILGVW